MVRFRLLLLHGVLGLLLAPLALRGQAPHAPAQLEDGWAREDAASAGFDAPKLHAVIDRLMNGELNIHGIVVERHGRLVAEAYRSGNDKTVNSLFSHTRTFSPAMLHDTRSVGKSVISLLAGIAQQQGKFPALGTPVAQIYPDEKSLPPSITLEHFLTMSSGLKWHEGGDGPDDEHKLMWKWTPTSYVLSRPVAAAPGATFNYNSGGTLLLADLLARGTGMPWKEYARTALFDPLGITEWEWKGDFYGRPMSYTGLRMRPRDMAKLGRLVLNRGQWKGKQLVPAAWIDASLKPRLSTGFDETQYGYFWWTGTAEWKGRRLAWAAAFGNGAQRIFVVPELDLGVVITAGAYGDGKTAREVNARFRELVATVQ